MTDERDDDALPSRKPPPVTPEEISEFERAVRELIHRRSAFDKHYAALDEMISKREEPDAKPDE